MGRWTLARMMGVVVVVALVLAALQAHSRLAMHLTFNGMVGLLLTASVLARTRTGDAGAWWFGFALLGWANLVLCFVQGDSAWYGPRWVTHLLVNHLFNNVFHPWITVFVPDRGGDGFNTLLILTSLPAGLIGGTICRAVAKRGKPAEVVADRSRD